MALVRICKSLQPSKILESQIFEQMIETRQLGQLAAAKTPPAYYFYQYIELFNIEGFAV
jgi:hypothetical protein